MAATPRIVRCTSCAKKNRVPAAATGTPRCAACKTALPWIADAIDADWRDVVEESPVPVVVDFWADWCGPCRVIGPSLEELAGDLAGRVKLVKVDVDASPSLSQRFQIRGIPMLALLDRGSVLDRRTGAAPKHELRRWIEAALPAPPAHRTGS